MIAAGGVALPRFLVLYAALYAAFGVQSPYLPALLEHRGLAPEAIALVLSSATAVRLAAGPLAGRLADRWQAPGSVFGFCAAAAAVLGLFLLPAEGLVLLLAVSVLHAAALAPLAPLSDTLALGAAAPGRAGRVFYYGWVRGAGSAAFIVGSIVSGQLVLRLGLGTILCLAAGLLITAGLWARRVPRVVGSRPLAVASEAGTHLGEIAALLRMRLFRRAILVASLILGSHALHDSFAMIRWGATGISPDIGGLLWSESVAAEVVVFLVVGRPLLERIGAARAAALAAIAGVVRWVVMGATTWLPAMMLIQPLHGITFALLHLACMRILAEIVPPRLAATALALYGTVAIGAVTALLTLVSGPLYARFGGHGFWAMAALCVCALPVALALTSTRHETQPE